MKKILIVLGMFQPRPSANGICSEKIIHSLIENGFSVDCVANRVYGRPNIDVVDGINVYRIKPRLTYKMSEWADFHSNQQYSRAIRFISLVLNKLKLLLMLPFWPVLSWSYTCAYCRKVLELHSQNHYDAVIGVYAPLDSLYGAYCLKKFDPNIKCVLYFLDSLSGGYGLRVFSQKMNDKRCLTHEKKIMNVADRIIVMKSSKAHHCAVNCEYVPKMKFMDIPLFDKKLFQTDEHSNETYEMVRFTYVGSISRTTRDPSFLLRMLIHIKQERYELCFAGPINCMDLFSDIKSTYGERLRLIGRVSHAEALKEISNANVLLNIGNTNESMVPSKIFEYISSGKPIITTYSIDREPSLEYLKNYPLMLAIDERRSDYETIAEEIFAFLRQCRTKTVDLGEIEKIFCLNTPEAFADEIETLLGEKNEF